MRQPIEPLLVADLLPEMRAELLRLLAALDDEGWARPTACGDWTVCDIALHLLGDDVGLISNLRDGDGQYFDFQSWGELVSIIDAQNHIWIRAARRLSRRLLLDLLAFTGEQVYETLAALDPFEPAGPIGWAGPGPDPRWLHVAREVTEYWTHHQHICDALGVESLKSARYLHPVLSAFVHALPLAYRRRDAALDTLVKVVIGGEGGGEWHVVREEHGWALYAATDLTPASTVILGVETAWRLFTRGLDRETARPHVLISGDTLLGEIALEAVAMIV